MLLENKVKLLLVDDDKDILWINTKILTAAGYSVDTADDPEEALKKINNEPYRVVILDYIMPKMKGDELAQRILEHNNEIGVIIVTGYADLKSSMEGAENDNPHVMLKPISADELIDTVRMKVDTTPSFSG